METIPKFTRTGYKKMRMPQKMHKMILKARQIDNFTYPDCEPNWPMHNCQRITKEGKIGKIATLKSISGIYRFELLYIFRAQT